MSDRKRHGFILLLVAALLAASVFVITTQRTILGLDLQGGVELTYQAQGTPQNPVNQQSLQRAVDIMRSRVDQLGVSEPEIQIYGKNEISVGLPDVHDVGRAEREVGQTAQLYFYDWEANVLNPANGKPVAGQLLAQNPTAVQISRGIGNTGPGVPGAGGVSLYKAVQLASKQPFAPLSKTQSRKGPQYYIFGAPGSAACAAAAKAFGVPVVQGQRCLLAQPASSISDLKRGLPSGVSASDGHVLKVPQGTVVLQAANVSASQKVSSYSSNAQFYVLRDNVSLTGNDITNPREGSDTGGNPDVQFGFNGAGRAKFQKVTAAIAHRGQNVSVAPQMLMQHFAVALDNQLLTVPQIDFHPYPDGIIGGAGADITGGFTSQSARALARELRMGALPLELQVVRPG
ncbi:MAG: preprotein translocase subunit SecD [Solirubrobacteraceae bacterium]